MGLEFKLMRRGKTKKYEVKARTGLYIAGAATAIGLAAFLYNKLKDRIEFSIGPRQVAKKARAVELKEKLQEKEALLTRGETERLEKKIEKIMEAGKRGEQFSARALRRAAVEYVTEDIEEKLAVMDISKKRLERIVKEVHDRTQEILALTDIERIINRSDTIEVQTAAIIRAIKPQLLEEIKKIRKR